MNILDYILGGIFIIALTYFIVKYRKNDSFNDFSRSNQSIGLWIIFASLSATFIGPGFSLGLVNKGSQSGLFMMSIISFYGVAKIIEGTLFADKIRKKFTTAFSIGDIIAGRESHNHKFLHLIVGFIAFAILIGFSAVIVKAGGEMLNHLTGISKLIGSIIVVSVVAIYSYFGGIKASIYTDAIQFFIFVILVPLLIFFLLSNSDFSISDFQTQLSQSTKNALQNSSNLTILGMVCTWFFGEMLIPPTINRILSTKSSIVSRKGLILSGSFMILWLFIMLLLGIMAKSMGVDAGDQTLLVLGEKYLTFGTYGIFIIAMTSIVMSSLDSLINSASIVFTQDIVNNFKKVEEIQKLKIAKLSTVIIAFFAVLISLYFQSLLSGLLFVYSLWAPAILVTLFASIYLKKVFWQSAITSIIVGIVTSIIWMRTDYNAYIPSILFGLFMSAMAYFTVHSYMLKK